MAFVLGAMAMSMSMAMAMALVVVMASYIPGANLRKYGDGGGCSDGAGGGKTTGDSEHALITLLQLMRHGE